MTEEMRIRVNAAAEQPDKIEIVQYPHPALLEVAQPIDRVTPEICRIGLRMIELMQQYDGIGLAANQIGLPIRMFVAYYNDPDAPGMVGHSSRMLVPMCYINPVLSDFKGKPEPYNEGCLSWNWSRPCVIVKRPPCCTMTWQTASDDMVTRTEKGFGMLARCWQHEVDHLNGINVGDPKAGFLRKKGMQHV